jgi:hypothetical protein
MKLDKELREGVHRKILMLQALFHPSPHPGASYSNEPQRDKIFHQK